MFQRGQRVRCIRADDGAYFSLSTGEKYKVVDVTVDGKLRISDLAGRQTRHMIDNVFEPADFKGFPKKHPYSLKEIVILMDVTHYPARYAQAAIDRGMMMLYGRYEVCELHKDTDIVGIKKIGEDSQRVWVGVDSLKKIPVNTKLPSWF